MYIDDSVGDSPDLFTLINLRYFFFESGKPAQSEQKLYITVTPVVFKTPDKDGFVESLYRFCLFFWVVFFVE